MDSRFRGDDDMMYLLCALCALGVSAVDFFYRTIQTSNQ
jgi:hypothetical protein